MSHSSNAVKIVAVAASWGLLVACGGEIPLGAESVDATGPEGGGPGGGGRGGGGDDGGRGGSGDVGGRGGADASAVDVPLGGAIGGGGATGGAGQGGAPGTGGMSGAGGAWGTGGIAMSGGVWGTGGIAMSGGAGGTVRGGAAGALDAGAGGRGTGGATTAPDKRCGTISGLTCPSGQFCDLASNCGAIEDAAGVCLAIGEGTGCITVVDPVCGCDGRTYSNDCERARQGVLKSHAGACARDAGPFSYTSALLGWFAPAGVAGTGPAVVVSSDGWAVVWKNTRPFEPEMPPSSADATYSLTKAQTDDLFGRLAAVNMFPLPHDGPSVKECYTQLSYRLCDGCLLQRLSYNEPAQVLPEMEDVFAWFDSLLVGDGYASPREYCGF